MRLLSVFLLFICVVLISGCGSETELSVEPTMAADESEAIPFFNQFMAVSYTHLTLPTNREV